MQPVKGESTIRWQAHDANGDELTHSLFFREFDAEDGGAWTLLKETLETTSHPLDSTALPDWCFGVCRKYWPFQWCRSSRVRRYSRVRSPLV